MPLQKKAASEKVEKTAGTLCIIVVVMAVKRVLTMGLVFT